MKITNIPIAKLHSFEGHPYKVLDDGEMDDLTESVKENGILSPLIVRPLEKAENEYEVISGHRRLHAAERTGVQSVPAFVYEIDHDEAAVLLVDSNLHREHILPSEKAFAYKLKLEALAHQGKTSRQVGEKWSVEQVSEAANESQRQVHRYIRLTKLVPELLQMMDEGRIAFSVGVELSFLTEKSQRDVLNAIELNDCTPSYSQACKMHREAETITAERISEIMAEEKPNQREQIKLRREDFRKYFPASYTDQQIIQDIMRGLDLLKRQRSRNHDAR